MQGDIKFLEYLVKMGCKIKENKQGVTIKGPFQPTPLGTVNMNSTPDLVMTFAILALFAEGETLITDVGNLKDKESNRLKALETELKKLGADVVAGKDYIKINGKKSIGLYENKKKIRINTYNDHRIAMSFGIIKDFFPNIVIENPKCVSKSYTNFWEDINKLQ